MLQITYKNGKIEYIEKALLTGLLMMHRKDIIAIAETGKTKTELRKEGLL